MMNQVILRVFCLALALIAAGCEVEELYVGDSSSGVAFYFSGRWIAADSAGHPGSTLNLNESQGTVGGTWYGPAGSRSVWGTSSGSAVVLDIQGGDVWRLTLSSNVLEGTGRRPDGGVYPIRFALIVVIVRY
jgi:hypothetical protein